MIQFNSSQRIGGLYASHRAIPQVVEEVFVQFGDCFPNEPLRQHVAEYLTGLLVAEHKTVSGIARKFAAAPDQSCLNRWLNDWNGFSKTSSCTSAYSDEAVVV